MKITTAKKITQKKYMQVNFSTPWYDLIGNPELRGIWIIWGNSGNGKSNFAFQLAKYLSTFNDIAYNSLEEGTSLTMKNLIEGNRMYECKNRFLVIEGGHKESIDVLLKSRRAPKIVFIDSFQFFGLTKPEYIAFKAANSDKLIVFISHAEGKNPEGRTAKFVRYDADVKIRVEGFKAFATSRYGGGTPYTVWNEGARKYWDKSLIEDEG